MSERIDMPFTSEHFVAFCKRMVGQPYWYGCCGYKATTSLLNRKAKQYPNQYTSARMSRYKQDIQNKAVVADCIGGLKGYMWSGGGQSMLDAIGTDAEVTSNYGSHNCPDKGANSMFSYAKSKGCQWGEISSMPEVPGLALTKDGHVGYYIGNGWAVEWQGFAYGCVKTQVSKRSWTHWYQIPFIDYGDAVFAEKVSETVGSVEDTSASDTKQVRIVCNSGSVNIRMGNSTKYSRITTAKNGETFDWVATAENGWHAIVVKGKVGWVSGEYSKLE